MTLTKREKVLLTIMAILLLAVGTYYFLISPMEATIDSEQEHLEQLTYQRLQMDALLQNPAVRESYDQAIVDAQNNYDQFYNTLNSYTIDNILNGLMDEHALHVQNLQISPYVPTEESAILPPEDASGQEDAAEGETEENLLLLSTVTLLATGGYNDIKAYVDALNAKSFCLQVDHLQIDFDVPNDYGDECRASMTLLIYGIALPDDSTAGLV